MYKISVPVYSSTAERCGRDKILKELRRLDAERVMLALDTYQTDAEKHRNRMETLADNVRFFHANGFEVGAWTWTFWVKGETPFSGMRSIHGTEIPEFKCPLDEAFVQFAAEHICDIARTGVDMILFDDDFRYGFLSDSPACLCDRHMAAIERLTGEHHTRAELERAITTGGKNPCRDAFLQANGDAFRHFAAQMRRAVDSVDPKIRLGACTCMTAWDIDGTDAAELAAILAGGTRPYARLIGAPYWAVERSWGNGLADVIELERMESAWTRKGNIELMAEGDVWPRPRSRCPANYLEGFDTAIRASGCTDGILKYGIDYVSNADYETGYATLHQRNKALYAGIDRLFAGKTGCGVRVYESMKKVADREASSAVNGSLKIEELFFSQAARMLAGNAIPTVYTGEGVCGITFGENARHLPPEALKNGLILDLAAAEILMRRGVDVGIEHIGAALPAGECERFLDDNNHIRTDGVPVHAVTLKAGAEILSDTETAAGVVPLSFRYENESGERFLVLNIDPVAGGRGLLRHYARGRQLAKATEWLSGQALPAYVYGVPGLYLLCRKSEDAMAVGLWNFYADPAMEPVVKLDRDYAEVTWLNGRGRLEGRQVRLEDDIPPYGFAAFEVRL